MGDIRIGRDLAAIAQAARSVSGTAQRSMASTAVYYSLVAHEGGGNVITVFISPTEDMAPVLNGPGAEVKLPSGLMCSPNTAAFAKSTA
jgi:hypothetical protein